MADGTPSAACSTDLAKPNVAATSDIAATTLEKLEVRCKMLAIALSPV